MKICIIWTVEWNYVTLFDSCDIVLYCINTLLLLRILF